MDEETLVRLDRIAEALERLADVAELRAVKDIPNTPCPVQHINSRYEYKQCWLHVGHRGDHAFH